MDFDEEDHPCRKRAAMQHLAMFVPLERFLSDTSGDVNTIWERQKKLLPRRLAAITRNIQLLRRSAEDAKRDARQWEAQSGEEDPTAETTDHMPDDREEGDQSRWRSTNTMKRTCSGKGLQQWSCCMSKSVPQVM
jgi:hypothetical protein